MKITLVKKILEDGSPCPKCAEVQERLEKDGYIDRIDKIVYADVRDENSEGMQLAKIYNAERAPFFIVDQEKAESIIYTIYLKFVNEILKQETSESDAAQEIMENHDLDFL